MMLYKLVLGGVVEVDVLSTSSGTVVGVQYPDGIVYADAFSAATVRFWERCIRQIREDELILSESVRIG